LKEVINLTDKRAHHNEKVMASILLTIYRMNESTQRTKEDLIDWFSHLNTPKLIDKVTPLTLKPIVRPELSNDF
jgi:hypothetical protein